MPSRTSMLKLAKSLFVRHFPTQIDDNSNQCSQNDNHNSHISTPTASLRIKNLLDLNTILDFLLQMNWKLEQLQKPKRSKAYELL